MELQKYWTIFFVDIKIFGGLFFRKNTLQTCSKFTNWFFRLCLRQFKYMGRRRVNTNGVDSGQPKASTLPPRMAPPTFTSRSASICEAETCKQACNIFENFFQLYFIFIYTSSSLIYQLIRVLINWCIAKKVFHFDDW